MDQNQITINFKKENLLSVTGNKFILSYNASKFLELLDGKNEITIDLNEFNENISAESFNSFINASFDKGLTFESQQAFEIQRLCQIYGNNSLLSEINEFIEQIPEPQRAIIQFKLDKNEDSKKYIAEHFPECFKYNEFKELDPSVFYTDICSRSEFENHVKTHNYQHCLARYLVNFKKNQLNQNFGNIELLNLIQFQELSPADIKDLIDKYPEVENRALIEAPSSIKTIHDIIEQGNKELDNLSKELDDKLNEKKNTIKDIYEMLNEIQNDEKRAFVEINAQKTKVYWYETETKNQSIIQQNYEKIKLLYEQVVRYNDKINENFRELNNRITEASGLSDQLNNTETNE